mmetsp:Transcript_11202/g.16885  ORF Transcript_11202/g.16885 Transcript_11202/m.16885 type:complete len:390 (-) Transcript_11202:39-1208(-)
MTASSKPSASAALFLSASALLINSSCGFTLPTHKTTVTASSSLARHNNNVALFAAADDNDKSGGTLFFATVAEETTAESKSTEETKEPSPSSSNDDNSDTTEQPPVKLFDTSTLQEANDALTSVGWAGVAPMQGEGEMTSEDPFVKQIDESIMAEMGVGLDQLLNPAKVVNLERDLYNLRNELATLTGATINSDSNNTPLTTTQADAGGGGEDAEAIRAKITKKEKDLAMERRSVFRGWLKNVFLGQAVLSMALSFVMATHPDVLFGSFDWFNNVSNMDTSIKVLGFWWWWLFIVPSLRSRRPTGMEKKALDIAFLGTPLISLLSPVVTKDTGLIWVANFMVVAGAYGFAFAVGEDEDDGEDGGKDPAWLKFIYKSLDFGSGRERGARR